MDIHYLICADNSLKKTHSTRQRVLSLRMINDFNAFVVVLLQQDKDATLCAKSCVYRSTANTPPHLTTQESGKTGPIDLLIFLLFGRKTKTRQNIFNDVIVIILLLFIVPVPLTTFTRPIVLATLYVRF